MDTNVIENGDSAEIILKGRIDTTNYKEAEAVFTEVGNRVDHVTLDLAELNYISSAGIRALRTLYMILYKKGGTLKSKNVGKYVREVLEMTGLTGLLGL